METRVTLSKQAVKDIDRIPGYVKLKFLSWAKAVEIFGLPEVRVNMGYHDEALKGDRSGQRSIRLSKAYRAIYVTHHELGAITMEIVEIQAINKHRY